MTHPEPSQLWIQKEFVLPSFPRGFHLITSFVLDALSGTELPNFRLGLLQLFIKHTSASLTINENADPEVRTDLELAFDHVVSETLPFDHIYEGSDDMPAHVKAALIGSSLAIPVTQGRLNLGTWQGIYLCEHRNNGGNRSIVLTANGIR